jgi:hypothetical protein
MSEPNKKSPFDLKKIRDNLPKYTVEKLCEMIVADRYFKFNDEIQVMCMEELARRREAGDPFEFETYIETSLKELPVLSDAMPNIRDVLSNMVKTKGLV